MTTATASPVATAPSRRRAHKFWRRVRSLVALVLPPLAFQWVRHLVWHGSALPVRFPRTHTHHIFLKMARDRNPLLRRTSDKLGLREYVQERLGDGYLPELHGVLQAPEELLRMPLPRRYVVKGTHGSGMVAIVTEDGPATRAAVAERARRWLKTRYWRKNGEWCYRGITPRIIVEEYLGPGDGGVPPDWKWLVFGGRAGLVQVFFDRFANRTRRFYHPDGEPLDLSRWYPTAPDIPLPPSFGAMRSVAERLAEGLDFVRVDLYALGDRVVVGEMTHYPNAGNKPFEPPEWDLKLGALWPRS
jgi:hypothetical protein